MAQIFGLPSGGGSGTDTYDIIYTNHNGDGTNVKIGDDAWIGDINYSNSIGIKGIQDPAQAQIVLGNAKTAYLSANATDLVLGGATNVQIEATTSPGSINLSAYNGAYINGAGDSLKKIVTFNDLKTAPATFASGAFHDQTTFGPYSANTEQALSYQSTDWSSDVRIAGINNSQITFDRAGKFNIQFSSQFHATSGGAIVYIWLKKNGTTVPWSGTRFDITANNPYAVAAWNWFIDAAANDYYEIFWSTPSTTVKVESITGLTGTKATVPSNILTVNQVG